MQTIRTLGLIFFAAATLFALVAMFTPTGEAIGATGGATGETLITQTYKTWGMDVERAPAGAASLTTSAGWFDDANDGTAGITYLRAAPVLLSLGLVGMVVGLILTAAPATRAGISGGIIGAIAFVAAVFGVVLHLAGLVLRVEGFLGSPEFLAIKVAVFLLVFALACLLVATLLGLRSTGATQTEHRAPAPTATRRLMCPQCHTINVARIGVLPTCGNCGYST